MLDTEKIEALPGTRGLIGNPMDVFNALGPEVQGWIIVILGFFALIFLVITIISIFGHAAGSGVSSLQRDSAGRTHHWAGMVSAGMTVILVMVLIGLVFAFYF